MDGGAPDALPHAPSPRSRRVEPGRRTSPSRIACPLRSGSGVGGRGLRASSRARAPGVMLAPGSSDPAAARLVASLPAPPRRVPTTVVLASGPRGADLGRLATWLEDQREEAA